MWCREFWKQHTIHIDEKLLMFSFLWFYHLYHCLYHYISLISMVYIITHNSLNFRGKSVHYGWNLPPLLFKNMLSSFDLQFSYLLVHSGKFSFILSLLLWIIFTLEVFLPFSKQKHFFFFKLTIILSWTQYCLITQARRASSWVLTLRRLCITQILFKPKEIWSDILKASVIWCCQY